MAYRVLSAQLPKAPRVYREWKMRSEHSGKCIVPDSVSNNGQIICREDLLDPVAEGHPYTVRPEVRTFLEKVLAETLVGMARERELVVFGKILYQDGPKHFMGVVLCKERKPSGMIDETAKIDINEEQAKSLLLKHLDSWQLTPQVVETRHS